MTRPDWTPPPNWPKPTPGWSPPPGWRPPAQWGPAPQGWDFYPRNISPSPSPSRLAKGSPRLLVVASIAALSGLVIGIGIGNSTRDSGTTSNGATSASQKDLQSQISSLTDRNKELQSRLEQAGTASSAAPVPPPSPPAKAGPDGGDQLSDGDFTSERPMLKDNGIGGFGGTSRVTNTSSKSLTATFTYTLFKGDQQVGTAVGVVNQVEAGSTATVQLSSQDDFVKGVDRVEFQVDAAF